MAHWAERWIGRGRDGDCADFVASVQRVEFGRDVALPPSRPSGHRGRDLAMASAASQLAVRRGKCADCGAACNACVAPQEGDLVLLRAAGRQRSVGHHAGVWCAPGGQPSVLHRLDGLGGCLHPLRAVPGLEVEGVYRWL